MFAGVHGDLMLMQDGERSFMVRFAGNDAGFPFWLEVMVGDMLLCDVHRMLASETLLFS